MTPTEQDKELRETVRAMFTTEDPRRMMTITDELVLENLMELITADCGEHCEMEGDDE